MKKKNSGFTLIELLISMAILAILGIAIGSFIYTAMRQYQAARAEVEVQTEAQMVQNQLQNLLIDASKGICDGTEAVEIYNYDADTGKKEKILISYLKAEEKLLYSRYYLEESGAPGSSGSWKIEEDAKDECFGAYVTDFDVRVRDEAGKELLREVDQGKEVGWVEIDISYQLGIKEYQSTFKVTPRNAVIFSEDVNELYK